jgi:hypothetical protein
MSARNQTVHHIAAVTPSDSADLTTTTSGLHVNGDGDVKMTLASGETVTLALLAGISYPYEVKRVWATDTEATGIHALYF